MRRQAVQPGNVHARAGLPGLATACAMALMAPAMDAAAWDLRQVRLVEADLVAAPVLGPRGPVCSAYDETVCADVSAFYQPNKNRLARFGLIATMTTAASPAWGLRLQFTEGLRAPKATLEPRLVVGLIVSRTLRSQRTLTLEAYSSLGGDVVHRPCVDAYDRQYHCATLTAWEGTAGQSIRTRDVGFRLAWRF